MIQVSGPEQDVVEIVIPASRANLYSFIVFAISFFLYGAPYVLLYDLHAFLLAWKVFLSDYLTLAVSVVAGVILHESLHAVSWAYFLPRGLRSIKFGFNWKNAAPFVHCKEYLTVPQYAIGVASPGLVLGFLPAVVSFVSGSGWFLCFATFFTAGAAGDFASILKLRSFKPSDRALDHPDHLGFIIRKSSPTG